jgi:hypothetical protein
MEERKPSLRQRELSMRLRRFREVRRLSVGEVAEGLMCSATKISRIEDRWWAHYEDLGVGPYFDLEQEAKAITYYSMSYIYGLLQTDGYARAIIRSVYPLMDNQVLKER